MSEDLPSLLTLSCGYQEQHGISARIDYRLIEQNREIDPHIYDQLAL